MSGSPLRGGIPVVVRMRPEQIENLDRAAAANLRSRSAEVLFRLAESMRGESFDAHGCIVKQAPAQGNAVGEPPKGGQ